MTPTTVPSTLSARKRPLGVWLVALLNMLGALIAALSAVVAVLLLLGGGDVPWRTPFDLAVGVPYHVLSVVLTIGVWRGDKRWLRIYLWVIGAYAGLTILFVLYRSVGDPTTTIEATIGGVLGTLLWMLLYLWYFRRPTTRAFYQ